MARIRTIKPEFPQSESMGRVSRDARLLFVQLWCICDDHGRTRAASRMLASLLFPYDDDAPSLIDGWLSELQREGCVRLYEHEGSRFLEIPNWLKHQKIDKPSKPQFPAFDESSRILANPREHSWLDQGPRTKDQGPTRASNADALEVCGTTSADLLGDQGPAPIDRTPHAEIVAAYHAELQMLPRVREWDLRRQALLRSRWRESKERQSVDWWREFFRYVAGCPFLVGNGGGKDRDPFIADLEWLISPRNFRKVIEGRYEPRGNRQ